MALKHCKSAAIIYFIFRISNVCIIFFLGKKLIKFKAIFFIFRLWFSVNKKRFNFASLEFSQTHTTNINARMAKLVDALVSGTSGRKAVQVRSLFRVL